VRAKESGMKKMYRFPFESVFESKKELRKEIGKLEETTDEILINSLISERRNTLNPYAPLNERLKKINTNRIYSAIRLLELILSCKSLLPALIGLDDSLDKIISERLGE